jgi:hypothetical protein
LIYEVRRGPIGKATIFRLEDGALTEEGPRSGRYVLASLKAARLARLSGRFTDNERRLTLTFGRRLVAISSHGYRGFGLRADQGAAFDDFARGLLAAGQAAAPGARFRLAGQSGLGLYGGIVALLAVSFLLVLGATLLTGQFALGLDLSVRISFVLILLLTPLPWLRGWREQAFDPLSPPL